MGIIGLLVLFWLSAYIPSWVGVVIAIIAFGINLASFIERIIKRQELKILNTIGTLAFCVFFIWLMIH